MPGAVRLSSLGPVPRSHNIFSASEVFNLVIMMGVDTRRRPSFLSWARTMLAQYFQRFRSVSPLNPIKISCIQRESAPESREITDNSLRKLVQG